MEPLSVLITTRDEADRLPECLESCSFADEIVVVDSGSRDGTVEVARKAGARVLAHEFEGHAAQKNWGLDRVAHRWVLILDADERVSPALREEILRRLAVPARRDGYWIRRRSTFLGRSITGCGWQRDRVLRLFDRTKGRYPRREVHEEVEMAGDVGALDEPLLHHPARNLSDWIRKTTRYAELGAEETRRSGRRYRPTDLFLRPPARFVKQYLGQGGWRDGVEGFVLCAISAFGVLLKYAHLREGERSGRREEG
jgi:glycosyltransferase involved in cell wall biosynthesis